MLVLCAGPRFAVLAGTESTDPAREQIDKLLPKVGPMLAYLSRRSKRMNLCGMGSGPPALASYSPRLPWAPWRRASRRKSTTLTA